jgi:hypothetical protein
MIHEFWLIGEFWLNDEFWFIVWLIMMGWDCLTIAATKGTIVHPPGGMWTWRTTVMMMMPLGDNSWLDHQSSLAVISADISGESRRNEQRNENFACQYLKYPKGSLPHRKILRHVTSGFTSHPKEGVLRILIVLKNPSPLPRLNPRPLGPVASTITTTPLRRPWRVLQNTNNLF